MGWKHWGNEVTRHAVVVVGINREEGTEFIHLGFLVEDLAATYRRLLALQAPIMRDDVKERRPHEAAETPVGSFKALDPDGNVIDISDRPDEWRV